MKRILIAIWYGHSVMAEKILRLFPNAKIIEKEKCSPAYEIEIEGLDKFAEIWQDKFMVLMDVEKEYDHVLYVTSRHFATYG